MWKKIKPYAVGILIPLVVGGLSAFFTRNNMNIYDEIIEPPLSPPMFLFPIVWSILFILMGIGSTIVYKSTDPNKGTALKIYGFQLVVNFFWSIIFFNMKAYLFAFAWLVLLWLLILAMIIQFTRINKISGLLQIPYLIWTAFAGYLTLAIFLLNR